MNTQSLIYAIGDIRGSLAKLTTLIARCEQHAGGRSTTFVFLGDLYRPRSRQRRRHPHADEPPVAAADARDRAEGQSRSARARGRRRRGAAYVLAEARRQANIAQLPRQTRARSAARSYRVAAFATAEPRRRSSLFRPCR